MGIMNTVVGLLGLVGTVAASFLAGWILGPRVITPLAVKLLSKVGVNISFGQ